MLGVSWSQVDILLSLSTSLANPLDDHSSRRDLTQLPPLPAGLSSSENVEQHGIPTHKDGFPISLISIKEQ